MMRTRLAIVFLVGCTTRLLADSFYPDTASLPSKQQLDALQAQIPQPSSSVPPTESPQGAPGSTMTFRRGDAVQPRITRSKTVTLAADGTATFDWTSQGALNTPVQVALTPVYAGAGVPKCWATATTATSVSLKCVMETVSLVTIVGITVGSVTNSSPAGLSVGVIALPPS